MRFPLKSGGGQQGRRQTKMEGKREEVREEGKRDKKRELNSRIEKEREEGNTMVNKNPKEGE